MIDLRKFASKDPSRSYIIKPWSRGEYSWATNGHIIVRVPRRADIEENEKAPDAVKIWPQEEPQFRPRPGFVFPDPMTVECAECDARGFEHDCPGCNCLCWMCEGAGELSDDENSSVTIGGVPFAMKYIRLIFALPSLLVPVEMKQKDKMWFRFGGGDGLLMPLMHGPRAKNWDLP